MDILLEIAGIVGIIIGIVASGLAVITLLYLDRLFSNEDSKSERRDEISNHSDSKREGANERILEAVEKSHKKREFLSENPLKMEIEQEGPGHRVSKVKKEGGEDKEDDSHVKRLRKEYEGDDE